ncbi:MAG TPA: hypothetical protein DCY59_03840, partial [Micrococcaceae bacterium]|nr:hypothetical protein [Micrococcaceae bacterium]
LKPTPLRAASKFRNWAAVGRVDCPLFFRQRHQQVTGPILAVELQFDPRTITFSAVADNDTIAITSGSHSDFSHQTLSSLWVSCIGKPLQWAWLTTNQRGYADGARLEFIDPESQ